MSELASRLQAIATTRRSLAGGERLFCAGDRVERLYLVLVGEIALERISPEGHRLILQRARAGDIVAEASIFAGYYHCDARSTAASTIESVSLADLEAAKRSDSSLMDAIARHLAVQLQKTRERTEILSLRRTRDRLDMWLSLNGGKMPQKGSLHLLAHELSVTPEALYREINSTLKKNRSM